MEEIELADALIVSRPGWHIPGELRLVAGDGREQLGQEIEQSVDEHVDVHAARDDAAPAQVEAVEDHGHAEPVDGAHRQPDDHRPLLEDVVPLVLTRRIGRQLGNLGRV